MNCTRKFNYIKSESNRRYKHNISIQTGPLAHTCYISCSGATLSHVVAEGCSARFARARGPTTWVKGHHLTGVKHQRNGTEQAQLLNVSQLWNASQSLSALCSPSYGAAHGNGNQFPLFFCTRFRWMNTYEKL